MKKIERKVANYLYRRQLFYTVRRHVDMLNHGEILSTNSVAEIIALVKDFGTLAIWGVPTFSAKDVLIFKVSWSKDES